jgi:hypothetical protein
MLKEFFGGISGYLPEGSIVLFGSLSHLARRGIENYAEECVKTKKVILNMIPKSCVISHVVLVPLGGCGGEALVRDLYDLDSWIRGGAMMVTRYRIPVQNSGKLLWMTCIPSVAI